MQNLPNSLHSQAQNVLHAAHRHCGVLLGAYLHGSVCLGGCIPGRSDLDLLIICREPLTRRQRLDFAADLLFLHNAPCPIELSVLTGDGLTRCPPVCSFHFSSLWAPHYAAIPPAAASSDAHQRRMTQFFETSALLASRFAVTPLLYGSLGLEHAADVDLHADDLDILIPRVFLTDQWDSFRCELEQNGYVLTDEHEHTFTRNGLEISFAQIEELESFAGIPMNAIAVHNKDGIFYKLLSLSQYLRVYTASSRDGYRANVRGKKDSEKIAVIRALLQLEPLLASDFPDDDLPPYFRVIRQSGIRLFGAPASALFPEVSDEAFLRFVSADLDDYSFDAYGQFASNVLTLPRILSFACTHEILTKVQAAQWAQKQFPQFADLIRRAAAEYETLVPQRYSAEELDAFRTFMIDRIRQRS